MRRMISSSGLAASLFLAACVAPEPPAPPPAPPLLPVASPAPPAPAPLGRDWRDWPVTPGMWSYRQDDRGSIALFGLPGNEALLTVRCDTARRRVILARAGSAGGGRVTVKTSFGDIVWTVADMGGAPAFAAADLDPRDAGLDRIAFSRGRFAVEMTGQSPIVVPAWPEFGRVVEDCR